ncbi:MAG: metal-dependent hydrolase [Deinococcus sp.]|nr:metal-dependent hydrolase [Deinococcus sp.]
MGSYREHVRCSTGAWVVVSFTTAAVASAADARAVEWVPLVAAGYPLALLGASFPDIDLANSIPGRRFRLALTLLCCGAALAAGLSQPQPQQVVASLLVRLQVRWWPYQAELVVGLLALVVGQLAAGFLAALLPGHRQGTHTLLAAVLLGGVTGYLGLLATRAFGYSGLAALRAGYILGAYAAGGLISHLVCDGILFRSATLVRGVRAKRR